MEITLKPPPGKVFGSTARFRVLVAGRRFGKTYLALPELCRAAAGKGRLAWYVAPTIKQARSILWEPLKEMTRPFGASKPNETNLRIKIKGGGTIRLRGAENQDSLRGHGLDFPVLDEYTSIAWVEISSLLNGRLFLSRAARERVVTQRSMIHRYATKIPVG